MPSGFCVVKQKKKRYCRNLVIKSRTGLMGGKDKSYKKDKKRKGTFDDTSKKKVSGRGNDESVKTENFTKHQMNYAPQKSIIRY